METRREAELERRVKALEHDVTSALLASERTSAQMERLAKEIADLNIGKNLSELGRRTVALEDRLQSTLEVNNLRDGS